MVIFLLIVTALLWGATPIFEKIGLSKVDPLVGVTVRSIIVTAGLLILIFVLGMGRALFQLDGKSVAFFGASGVMAGLLWDVDLLYCSEAGGHFKDRPHCGLLSIGDRTPERIDPRGGNDRSETDRHWIDRLRHLACQIRGKNGGLEYWIVGVMDQ